MKTLIAILSLLFLLSTASAATITMGWSGENNAPCAVKGYKVHRGTEPGVYTNVTDVGWRHMYTTENLPLGTYYFAVSAYSDSSEGPRGAEVRADLKDGNIVLVAPTGPMLIGVKP